MSTATNCSPSAYPSPHGLHGHGHESSGPAASAAAIDSQARVLTADASQLHHGRDMKNPLFLDTMNEEPKAVLTGSSPQPIMIPGEPTYNIITMYGFDYGDKKDEVVALVHRSADCPADAIPLVRMHSCCMTGEVFHSMTCDCRYQFDYAMKLCCASPYGMVLYMVSHEGRGVGIGNKIRICNLQQNGDNMLTANDMLGLPFDVRDFRCATSILKDHFKINAIKLITNNPGKRDFITSRGIEILEVINVPAPVNKFNQSYLLTKKLALAHGFSDLSKIYFYNAEEIPFGYLANFYTINEDPNMKLSINGVSWPSTEHYYQAAKFFARGDFTADAAVNGGHASSCPLASAACQSSPYFWMSEQIRLAPTAAAAKMLGRTRDSDSPDPGVDASRIDERTREYVDAKTAEFKAKNAAAADRSVCHSCCGPASATWPGIKDGVMRHCLREKFLQNADLAVKLLETGSAEIIENTVDDAYWGCGAGERGLNKLGVYLMEVRDHLKKMAGK